MRAPALALAAAFALAAGAAVAQPMDSAMPGMGQPPAGAEVAPPVAEPPAPPPPPPADHAADRYFGRPAMDQARAMLEMEHGGMAVSKLMLNLAEYGTGAGGAYRWNAEAWYGGDLNRLVLKSEGDGLARGGLHAGEAQALWSRAVAPYADLQLGVRQDFAPQARTYAAAGVQTLLPYWIEAEAALFVSTRGEVLARTEASYDLRLAQRLVLQPRAELNFAARDAPATRTGAGLSTAELGLRLRYEIRRELAPYVGVAYDRSVGRTADFARAAGEHVGRASFVVGLRAWY